MILKSQYVCVKRTGIAIVLLRRTPFDNLDLYAANHHVGESVPYFVVVLSALPPAVSPPKSCI